jgi:CRP-like cAMP-binding protein
MVVNTPSPNGDVMVAKMDSVFPLSDEEREAVLGLPMQVASLRADQDIVREGDRPSRCCVLLDGFCCTYKTTPDGKRQIMAFHVPGDIPDLQSLHLDYLDNSISTITSCRVGFIPHGPMRDLCMRFPRITSALWRETLIDGAVFREWLTNIGRRDAFRRMAHLLCEVMERLRAVGLVEENTCDLPMTQVELADATGLSAVHVNRVLQEMRASNLISLKGNRLVVEDWRRLKEVGHFDPSYLHLK